MKHLFAILILALPAACVQHSPGAKVSVVITTNASLTPTGTPLIP